MLSDVMVRVRMGGAGSESASDTLKCHVYLSTIPMVIVLLRSKSEQVPQIKAISLQTGGDPSPWVDGVTRKD